jgi:acetyltransferase-like isoleucine patch superfamily enzyme
MNQNIEIIGEGSVIVGEYCDMEPTLRIIFSGPGSVIIGDYCTFGRDVKIVVAGGNVVLGDWSTLHDRCLVLSSEGAEIGQHCWFGQNCVLDGTGGLTIGNGVRVGMYSQIWSHVAAGEQIEGCTLFGERPVTIEDDVWLVGSCVVSSGVTIGRRTVALINSNITKSWPGNVVLAGSPAVHKEGLSFYRDIAEDEKWHLLQGWITEIAGGLDLAQSNPGNTMALSWADGRSNDVVVFVRNKNEIPAVSKIYPQATICCLSTKRYLKRMSFLERAILKRLAGNKARFTSSAFEELAS